MRGWRYPFAGVGRLTSMASPSSTTPPARRTSRAGSCRARRRPGRGKTRAGRSETSSTRWTRSPSMAAGMERRQGGTCPGHHQWEGLPHPATWIGSGCGIATRGLRTPMPEWTESLRHIRETASAGMRTSTIAGHRPTEGPTADRRMAWIGIEVPKFRSHRRRAPTRMVAMTPDILIQAMMMLTTGLLATCAMTQAVDLGGTQTEVLPFLRRMIATIACAGAQVEVATHGEALASIKHSRSAGQRPTTWRGSMPRSARRRVCGVRALDRRRARSDTSSR
mmetsp:Transcript_17446/g.41409  ORF Transcript_17446/g.41409 Transcript_17446/m.41409 type:complete len:279 (-) Transcript_17446:1228-2064(-)